MSDFLTRDEFLAVDDISVKELTIPEKYEVWGGKKLHIKQLSRGKQDEYLRRQFGSIKMRQSVRGRRGAGDQELTVPDLYGHDPWLCVNSICDESGTLLFKPADEAELKKKSGGVIGWLAQQIIEFSDMKDDIDALNAAEDDVKN